MVTAQQHPKKSLPYLDIYLILVSCFMHVTNRRDRFTAVKQFPSFYQRVTYADILGNKYHSKTYMISMTPMAENGILFISEAQKK